MGRKKKPYVSRETDFLCGADESPDREYHGEGVLEYRTRTTKGGAYMEVNLFPAVDLGAVLPDNNRAAKRASGRFQRKWENANMKRRRGMLIHLLNANFDKHDIIAHLTTSEPMNDEEARRHQQNFVRRLKRLAKKRAHELHWVYVPEETGKGERRRWHLHMVLDGGWITRDELEDVWEKGKGHGMAKVERVKSQEKGLAGFAMYITQRKSTQEKMLKRAWSCSKNLKKPTVSVSKSKFSRKSVAGIIEQARDNANVYFEHAYPGYTLIERPEISYSDFLPGAYITAWMKKR